MLLNTINNYMNKKSITCVNITLHEMFTNKALLNVFK